MYDLAGQLVKHVAHNIARSMLSIEKRDDVKRSILPASLFPATTDSLTFAPLPDIERSSLTVFTYKRESFNIQPGGKVFEDD